MMSIIALMLAACSPTMSSIEVGDAVEHERVSELYVDDGC